MTARELIKQLKETPDAEVHIALDGISYYRVIEYGKKHGGSVVYLRPKSVIDYAKNCVKRYGKEKVYIECTYECSH